MSASNQQIVCLKLTPCSMSVIAQQSWKTPCRTLLLLVVIIYMYRMFNFYCSKRRRPLSTLFTALSSVPRSDPGSRHMLNEYLIDYMVIQRPGIPPGLWCKSLCRKQFSGRKKEVGVSRELVSCLRAVGRDLEGP